MSEFLKTELKKGQSVGIDPRVQSHLDAETLRNELAKKNINLIHLEENLIDLLWDEQPKLPSESIMLWDEKYSGESMDNKLDRIRDAMEKESADIHVLTTLDAIAWTFNIRSKDVDYNPWSIRTPL